MNNTLILSLPVLILVFACHEEEIPPDYPDFSQCNCNITYDPVYGVDSRTYLNECLLKCAGVDSISHGNCPDAVLDETDTLKWPIELVCIPIETSQSPKFVRLLRDGSAIYERPDGTFFRGNQNLCRCLAPYTLIATPEGDKPLQEMKEGDTVWTIDDSGVKVSKPILQIQQVTVGNNHLMLNIHLADGRKLEVSPLHPNKDGKALSDLKPGDKLDGSKISKMFWTHYQDTETWDLLPAGGSGLYWANGILIASTMKGQVHLHEPNPTN